MIFCFLDINVNLETKPNTPRNVWEIFLSSFHSPLSKSGKKLKVSPQCILAIVSEHPFSGPLSENWLDAENGQ